MNTAALNYFNAYPTPTSAGVSNNYLAHRPGVHATTTRLTFASIGMRRRRTRRSFASATTTRTITKTPELGNAAFGLRHADRRTRMRGRGDGGYTHIFTPTLVNQLLVGYNRNNFGYEPPFYGDAAIGRPRHRECEPQ